jgi:hypothetical protein
MSAFILNWQDPESRRWHPVGKLTRIEDFFVFAYTKGSLDSPNFVPFGNMSDQKSLYISESLFPIFANRVINERRPEFSRYSAWSGLNYPGEVDPLLLMARMGGVRATDTLQVYPVPEKTADGFYKTVFFCHGVSYLTENSQSFVSMLSSGERLYPMLDVQNPFDTMAVALRSADPPTIVGYCPRYLAKDIGTLAAVASGSLNIVVKQVNADAPAQYRLLCEAFSRWPEDFEPCNSEDQQTIVSFRISDIAATLRSERKKRHQTTR